MLIYPPDLKDTDGSRPFVTFRNSPQGSGEAVNDAFIFLPLPSSINFSDSANYNQAEVGFTGGMVLAAGKNQTSDGAIARGNAAKSNLENSMPKNMRQTAGLLASTFGGSEIGKAAGIATGTTLNKNLVTEFTGVGIRSFTFSFKLVSTSSYESQMIKQIINTFRAGMYPEGDYLQLMYPPNWYINFVMKGKDIEYIPKIFETFLTAVNSNYNPSSNMFHPDGAPIDTDLQLTFMESRALLKSDIMRLEEKAFKTGDFALGFSGVNTAEIKEVTNAPAALTDSQIAERMMGSNSNS